tara:strand:+ start:143 stop:610 length:468 start_codon:yes stop_codon:yes gene_type:complete
MDKRKFNGGARHGAGRKKEPETYLFKKIEEVCGSMVKELLNDEVARKKIVLMQADIDAKFEISNKKNQESIYIIEVGGKFKIGYTSNFNIRIKKYKTHNPDFRIVICVRSESAFTLEVALHERYKDFNISGEWFDLSKDQLVECLSIINNVNYGI